ncbi:hypothetical protein B0A50_06141 [Salinomyces thailandicus]|uniref:Nudix hydrolase domain-containing protein n=1 Tax=Salinomyces thailandicus TaxID=706561 RepID=A0A4U0TT02_9PEZI|nr:hypothetical protein B0A50_06141 [Salinomyces thailandica]
MSTFTLPSTDPPCPVHLPPNLTQDQLLNFPAFKTWSTTLHDTLALQTTNPSHEFHKTPYKLRSLTIQSADWFGPADKKRLGFLKLQAEITNDQDAYLPGSVFLRGGSLAMLILLQPDDAPEGEEEKEKYVILTVQPRIAAGALGFVELPAGMLDDSGTFAGGAAKEIKEETGLEVKGEELVDMTAMAMEGEANAEGLQKGVYSSPGGCDEFVPMFLYQKRVSRGELEGFKGKLTGLRGEGEKITLKVVKLEDLWREGVRDAKVLAALALYQNLKRTAKL